jgi:molybdenum cofactor biosynthesis protein B
VQDKVVPRVVAAIVSVGRVGVTAEEAAKPIIDEVNEAQFSFVRSVIVNGELGFIQQVVSTVSNTNEADAIVMVGGTGFGPRDFTCEAIETFVQRRIEGFGEAYRRLLREEFHLGAEAMLARATAGVYNRCLVFALPRNAERLRRAMRLLIVPTLAEAFQLASGHPAGSRG